MSSFNEIQNSEVQENDTEVDPDVEEANDANESELQLKGNEVPATSAETLIIKGNIVYCPTFPLTLKPIRFWEKVTLLRCFR